jgi:hypothetical protein
MGWTFPAPGHGHFGSGAGIPPRDFPGGQRPGLNPASGRIIYGNRHFPDRGGSHHALSQRGLGALQWHCQLHSGRIDPAAMFLSLGALFVLFGVVFTEFLIDHWWFQSLVYGPPAGGCLYQSGYSHLPGFHPAEPEWLPGESGQDDHSASWRGYRLYTARVSGSRAGHQGSPAQTSDLVQGGNCCHGTFAGTRPGGSKWAYAGNHGAPSRTRPAIALNLISKAHKTSFGRRPR